MEFTRPSVFRLAYTSIDYDGLAAFLDKAYAIEAWESDARSGSDLISEVAGRACYQSFAVGTNPNITKIREGNAPYLENILKQAHGSVLEHGSETYAIVNCSRVFTHEIVRHRLCAFSQESLRFVRLTDLKAYYPDSFANLPEGPKQAVHSIFQETFETLEEVQRELAMVLKLDDLKDFNQKKLLTSAMRRLAPIGLATTIIVTTNHRNWRHLISMRTSSAAEEEIRYVMYDLGIQLKEGNPAIYQDMYSTPQDRGEPVLAFNHGRV